MTSLEPATNGETIKETSQPYPVMLTSTFFKRRAVLVVGGGRVAERRVIILLGAGATVRLISPEVSPGLSALVSGGQLEWLARPWQAGDVRDFPAALLVFAATDDPAVNATVETEVREFGRLLNRADAPQSCDFTLPGVVQSGEITLTVSTGDYAGENSGETGAASPALTAHLRKKLAETIGPEYSRLSALLREWRPRVKAAVSQDRRGAFWKRIIESPALELLKQGREGEVRQLLEDYMREESERDEKFY